jgi:hypothetical protein
MAGPAASKPVAKANTVKLRNFIGSPPLIGGVFSAARRNCRPKETHRTSAVNATKKHSINHGSKETKLLGDTSGPASSRRGEGVLAVATGQGIRHRGDPPIGAVAAKA